MHTPTVGSFLFDYLYSKGVRHAFGIPGDFALPTFRWLDQSPITLYTMTHEPSVGFAADGYARVHGMGVALVTYCVGGLNLLNAAACAYAEKSPVLFISGGPSSGERKHDPLLHHKVKTFDTQKRIFDEVTCAGSVLLDPENAAEEIMRVVDTVIEQCRPGYLEIPYDVVDLPIKPPILRNRPTPESDPEHLEAALAEATAILATAQQPVIVADVEVARHGLTDTVLALAEQFNIPIAATLLSKSIVSEEHPLYIGVYSGGLSEPVTQNYVEESDCLILLGAFISDVFMGMNTARLDRKRTILSNTEKTRIGLHSYDNVQFSDFLNGLRYRTVPRKEFTNPYIHAKETPLTDAERTDKLNSEAFFRILGLTMDEDATVVCDTGDALLGAIGLRTSQRNNFIADAYYLSMGFATPAGIGAMVANPESRCYIIVGDGAFQMTGIELSTCAKYGMKPIVCILNNDGYGTQRHIIDGTFNDIHPWHYTRICELLGYGKSTRVTTKGELETALKEAAKSNDMTVIEVMIPRDDCSRPLRRMAEGLGKLRDAQKKK